MLDLSAAISPLYALSGFAVGMLVGMTGIGGGSLMTALTILIFSKVKLHGDALGALIQTVLGIALLLTASVLVFRQRILAYYSARVPELASSDTRRFTVLVGAIIGFLVLVSSVGAGAIGAIGLVLLYPKMPVARIVGSDIAHAVPLTFLAGLGHW